MKLNEIGSSVARMAIDACWLIPLSVLMYHLATGSDGHLLPPSVLLVTLVLPGLLWMENNRSRQLLVLGGLLALLWTQSPLQSAGLMHMSGEEFSITFGLLFLLGLLFQRSLAAVQASGRSQVWKDLLRGTMFTSGILFYLRWSSGAFPLWPVIALPAAIVASAVSERAALREPDAGTSLGLRSRFTVTFVLLFGALFTSLVLTAIVAPTLWRTVVEALAWIWGHIAQLITWIAYPVAYVAYVVLRWLQQRIPDRDFLEELTPLGPPLPPEGMGDELPPPDPLSALVFRLLLILFAGLVLWVLIRSLRRQRDVPERGDWRESRESLWDPSLLRSWFRQSPSLPLRAPHYRTETEQIVRQVYQRLLRESGEPMHRPDTPQTHAARLLTQLPESAHPALLGLVDLYVRVRYGPAEEEPQWESTARQLWRRLRRWLP